MLTTTLRALIADYSVALNDYFDGAGEEALLRGYQIGREALGRGVGVLQLAAIHQEALVSALLVRMAPEESARLAKRASELFAESLAPFEMSQRSTQEAIDILREENQTLEQRVEERTAELETALDQVSEHERIESMKDELVALVSHELRTPLTSIHAALDLIRGGSAGEIPQKVRRLVEIAFRNSQHLNRLITGILDIEKMNSGRMSFNMRTLDLLPLVEQSVEANRVYGEQFGVRLAMDEAEDVRVHADSDRLVQVMTNLLGNAAKFSPAGEEVLVSVSRLEGFARVSVADRGPGIPVSFRPRVFQRFAQAAPPGQPQRGGSGLGLSITKAIVESLGGRIGFVTETNAGTTFYFDLPEITREEPARERMEAGHYPAAAQQALS